ncbi:MAG: prolipoprotein diacylglyceryl transferase [Deltaproteobacteria bacterium]|jgi:phosphatidylglycerol:prolipoprotein diacylglycerol transferase|nr:prolipoprotein diacylglyceryl transferase [Deltaproteobacteria bacterium]
MLPQGLSLGPFSFSGYGLMVMAGVVAGLWLLGQTAPKAGTTGKKAFDMAFYLIIAGIFGSRLAYVLFHLPHYAVNPISMLKYWEGGLMFQGGLLAGLLVAVILARLQHLNLLMMADAIAPGLALGQAFGRLGCLLAGCCYGFVAPDSFPFGQTFPFGSLAPAGRPLYPTQAAESLGLFAITAILLFLLQRKRPVGLVLGAYLALSGCLRFIVDQYRGDFRGPRTFGLVPTSWAALCIALSGLFLIVFLVVRQKRKAKSLLTQASAALPTLAQPAEVLAEEEEEPAEPVSND